MHLALGHSNRSFHRRNLRCAVPGPLPGLNRDSLLNTMREERDHFLPVRGKMVLWNLSVIHTWNAGRPQSVPDPARLAQMVTGTALNSLPQWLRCGLKARMTFQIGTTCSLLGSSIWLPLSPGMEWTMRRDLFHFPRDRSGSPGTSHANGVRWDQNWVPAHYSIDAYRTARLQTGFTCHHSGTWKASNVGGYISSHVHGTPSG
jgi:hypothetical protein